MNLYAHSEHSSDGKIIGVHREISSAYMLGSGGVCMCESRVLHPQRNVGFGPGFEELGFPATSSSSSSVWSIKKFGVSSDGK